MLETKIEERSDGTFISRGLLDELEIREARVLVRWHEILIKPKSQARKLRGIVKTRVTTQVCRSASRL